MNLLNKVLQCTKKCLQKKKLTTIHTDYLKKITSLERANSVRMCDE